MVPVLFEVLGKQPELGWAEAIMGMQTRNWTTQPFCLDLEARERQAQAHEAEGGLRRDGVSHVHDRHEHDG